MWATSIVVSLKNVFLFFLVFRSGPPPLSRHYSGNIAKKVEDVMPIATGHEREELEAELQGRDILEINHPEGPFGTKEVYDKDTFSYDDEMGDAEFDIKQFIEALKMRLDDLPDETIIATVKATRTNCLSEDSCITWTKGKVVQNMVLRLRNVTSGEIEIQLGWIHVPGSKACRFGTHGYDGCLSRYERLCRENYGCEVVCFTADVGQGILELEGLEAKAKASGACQLVVKDLTEEFVEDYIYPCLRAGAVYERKYLSDR